MEIDFRRTFKRWASSAAVDEKHFHTHWEEDEAYRAHELGALSFADYTSALSERLGIALTQDQWLEGWNDVFVGPYAGVQRKLAALSGSLPLYAFTNTNPTHEAAWRARYAPALVHFREIFVSSSIGLRKPDLAAFEWVQAAMDLHPEKILFLDDNARNIEGAKLAGFRTARVQGEAEVLTALQDF